MRLGCHQVTYCIIGEQELVLGFSLVGVHGFVVHSPEEAARAFSQVTRPPSGDRPAQVLILTQRAMSYLREEVRAWQMQGVLPFVVEVPALHEQGNVRTSLRESIRQVIGAKV